MLAGDDEGPTGRDLKFRSPLSPHPRPPAAPLQVARPACGRRALPTVLPVVVLPLARHPCRCPAPPAARLLPCPLGPRVPTRGRPEGGTEGPTGGGSSQQSREGRPKPVRPALVERLPPDRLDRETEGGREGGGGRAGRQLLPPLTRRPDLALPASRPAPTPGTLRQRSVAWVPPTTHQATPPRTTLHPGRRLIIVPFSRYGN